MKSNSMLQKILKFAFFSLEGSGVVVKKVF